MVFYWLTLSYSSEASPALVVFRPHYFCLKLTISGFPYNCLPVSCVVIGFFLNLRSSIGLEIRPQSAFTAFMALLPSANKSAEWSGRLWQLFADSNGRWAHHYCQQRAVTPNPESLNSNKKGAKLSLLFAEGCQSHPTGRAAFPSDKYQGIFFKGGETLWWYK